MHIVHASHEVLSHWEGVGVMQNKGSINTVLITLPYSSVNKLGKLHTVLAGAVHAFGEVGRQTG